jgi:hypothetical protein
LLPDGEKALKIRCPLKTEIEVVDIAKLGAAWASDIVGWRLCRPIGDEWLRSGRTALLKVPSAARKGHFNYLLNPAAYRADEIEIDEVIGQPFPDYVTLNKT